MTYMYGDFLYESQADNRRLLSFANPLVHFDTLILTGPPKNTPSTSPREMSQTGYSVQDLFKKEFKFIEPEHE
jgi:hypothetical protein